MNTTEKLTHCQICARPIKARTGIIAHHGYERPQAQGWQTASCDGARQLPYEVSRDFIPVVIERYKGHAAHQEAIADEMLRAPSDKVTRVHLNRFGRSDMTKDFEKPAVFDPYAVVNRPARAFSYNSYENEFVKQYESHRANVKEIEAAIVFLQNRFNSWKKVEVL